MLCKNEFSICLIRLQIGFTFIKQKRAQTSATFQLALGIAKHPDRAKSNFSYTPFRVRILNRSSLSDKKIGDFKARETSATQFFVIF